MGFHLRDAREDDVPALARLHVETFNETHRGGHPGGPSYELRERQWRDSFAAADTRRFCFVVEDDAGELVAFPTMRATRQLVGLLAACLTTLVSCSSPGREAVQVTGPASLPRFDRVLLLETSAETSANVSVGDVNGDGNLDLVLAKGRHWPLVDRVLLGDGGGRFPNTHNLADTADRSYSGRLVDLNGDGALDVVISNDTPDPKITYLNDGRGHFHAGSTFGRPEWETRNASVADLDGDGQPDIVVANRPDNGEGSNYVCLNRGKGRFDSDCLAFSHEPATTITPADFNPDGRIDLAVPHRDRGQGHVYINGGKATQGNIRVRMVEYSPGYAADHWCRRGHVLLVLEGELQTELEDGHRVTLTAGTSYQVADNAMAHRSRTAIGAKLFIVD